MIKSITVQAFRFDQPSTSLASSQILMLLYEIRLVETLSIHHHPENRVTMKRFQTSCQHTWKRVITHS